MHRIHSGLTVAAALKDGVSSALKTRLAGFQGSPGKMTAIFSASNTTLFASAVVLPKCDEENLPETLVFTTTYWGPISNHLEDLIKTNSQFLHDIFSCCRDYTADSTKNEISLIL